MSDLEPEQLEAICRYLLSELHDTREEINVMQEEFDELENESQQAFWQGWHRARKQFDHA